jgi:hypothetical protein
MRYQLHGKDQQNYGENHEDHGKCHSQSEQQLIAIVAACFAKVGFGVAGNRAGQALLLTGLLQDHEYQHNSDQHHQGTDHILCNYRTACSERKQHNNLQNIVLCRISRTLHHCTVIFYHNSFQKAIVFLKKFIFFVKSRKHAHFARLESLLILIKIAQSAYF